MSRMSALLARVLYSLFELLSGSCDAPCVHDVPDTSCSARSVRAMMLRVLVVVPVLLVTHTSMRLMLMPLAMVGSDFMFWSYV